MLIVKRFVQKNVRFKRFLTVQNRDIERNCFRSVELKEGYYKTCKKFRLRSSKRFNRLLT